MSWKRPSAISIYHFDHYGDLSIIDPRDIRSLQVLFGLVNNIGVAYVKWNKLLGIPWNGISYPMILYVNA